MTPSRPLRSAGIADAARASAPKVRGLGVVETVIGRFASLVDEVMRCMATDLAANESADMGSRGMVVELAMLDSPEFAGGDEVAVAHHVELESARASGSFKQRTRAPVFANTRVLAPPRTHSAALT